MSQTLSFAVIRRRLAGYGPLKAVYNAVCDKGIAALAVASPQVLSRLRYREAWGKWPDLDEPATFDEKLIWLNLFWRHPLKTECGDKYTLRGYVERQGLRHLLPALYGVFESVGQVDFGRLPERFVLKCSHGCKCNVFCRDIRKLDAAEVRRSLSRWMATDYSLVFGELQYAAMTPRILCEEFLDDGRGQLPRDYKIYCFNGRPMLIRCCFERAPNGTGRSVVRDVEWNPVVLDRGEPLTGAEILAPESLPEMLSACRDLARPFPFVRMDFYSIHGRAMLGEMTFSPDACINRSYTIQAQVEMGRLIELPDAYVP